MGYLFNFEWGESWVVSDENFEWSEEYWLKVLARHIHFFREKVRDVKPVSLITSVEIWRDEDYIGLLSVSDNYVHAIMNGEDKASWRVEEL